MLEGVIWLTQLASRRKIREGWSSWQGDRWGQGVARRRDRQPAWSVRSHSPWSGNTRTHHCQVQSDRRNRAGLSHLLFTFLQMFICLTSSSQYALHLHSCRCSSLQEGGPAPTISPTILSDSLPPAPGFVCLLSILMTWYLREPSGVNCSAFNSNWFLRTHRTDNTSHFTQRNKNLWWRDWMLALHSYDTP